MGKISEGKKQEALALMSQGMPLVRVARVTGIHRETLRRWRDPAVYTRHKEANKRYADNNPEKVKHQKRTHRELNLEWIRGQERAKYAKHKKRIQAYKKEYYKHNAERLKLKSKTRYQANRETILAKEKKKRDTNEEYKLRKKVTHKLWAARNKARLAASKAGYRKAVKKATPPWLSAEQQASIDALYALRDSLIYLTGQQYHVDHIVPLTAKNILDGKYQHVACGLHVPWNLQVTTARYNLTKNCDLQRSV